jgi:outer membrane protein OmpA-like peptidoglycan-associated protein/polyisoprenoid-binding protein YceI
MALLESSLAARSWDGRVPPEESIGCRVARSSLRAALLILAVALGANAATSPAVAQEDPLSRGWQLDPASSTLQFQSVKNGSKVESSGFATYSGTISADGTAEIRMLLDSVDTKVDLRNVRMRFLFFETFQYPEAVITTRIDPAQIADLAQVRRKSMRLPFSLNLHGVSKDLEAEVTVTLLGDDQVAVASTNPIMLTLADFGLLDGLRKLEEAASVTIVPSTSVTFDFVFARNPISAPPTADAAPPVATTMPAAVALEAETFDMEACVGRFEILSRTGNIHFRIGSARLDERSVPLLDNIVDIINRCPELVVEIAGHTDSDGGEVENLRLSEARAASVARFLAGQGVAEGRMVSRGYGEARPVASNDTAENKRRNRRIEFAVFDG